MRIKRWKQVCIETSDGKLLAIEAQEYPVEASDRDILYLRDKAGWWWTYDWHGHGKTNDSEVMRVRIFTREYESWYDIAWRKFTKNWVHFFK